MSAKRLTTVAVCEAHVPFVSGGAELHVRGLVDQLNRRGFRAERVSVPFAGYPRRELLANAATWRLIDLTEANGQPIDLVIATKFPTYFVRHPNKVTWLFHQYRAIYELCGTPYSEFEHVEGDVRLRDKMIRLDREVLSECRRLFTNAKNTARRLEKYNGLHGEPLYHPPPLAELLHEGPFGDYIVSVGRLETVKRVELAIGALAHTDPGIRLIVVGQGPLLGHLQQTAINLGVNERIVWAGSVTERELVDLYAGALAVVYPPYDEDYGYVTLEAFLSGKPVITTPDAGGPLEFVEDNVTGLIADTDPAAIGAAVTRLAADRDFARALGVAGMARARTISWDGVVERLTGVAG